MSKDGFLPKKGRYKSLLSYQKSAIIYDCTFCFCRRFLSDRDRTIDQMVQAARSGKQNIIEGAKAGVSSAEMELKLTSVARASLEELLEDYHDFLRVRQFGLWTPSSNEAEYVRSLSAGKVPLPDLAVSAAQVSVSHGLPSVHPVFVHFMESRPPEVCANIMICLIHQCNFLLDRHIRALEDAFTKEGGLRERMYRARKDYRDGKR